MRTARAIAVSFLAFATMASGSLQPAQARDRSYYIAAVEMTWSYAPAGRDMMYGKPLPKLAPAQLGWAYKKLVYRGFTDSTFTHAVPATPQDAYLGLMGPAIRAEVGDTVVVTFKNLTKTRVGFDPVGGLIGPANGPIAPGSRQTYRYRVPDSAGPGPMDVSSALWTYRGKNADFSSTDDAGLFGPIVVTRRGAASASGAPSDVDREIFAVFSVSDESQSPLFGSNMTDPRINPRKIAAGAATIANDNGFVSINGFTFGDMPMIVLHRGQRVRWYLFTTSNAFDFHNPIWNGQTVVVAGHRADTADMTPSATAIADMIPDDPGTWMLYDAQDAFLVNGIDARFEVQP